jgi:hypothetical protein
MQVKVHHWYQQHRRQILPPVPLLLLILVANLLQVSTIPAASLPPVSTTDWCHLKENLMGKIDLYVNSTNRRCPKKKIKSCLIEHFFHLPPVSTTLVAHLELRISPRAPGAWGKLIHEKNLKSKIS